jgi:hypothetical protein
MIKQHNKYLTNVQVLNLPGFHDDITIAMGKVNHNLSKNDYSETTLNEVLISHYYITETIPMFRAVFGPYLGKQVFILPAKLSSAGSRLLETLHTNILRFMTPEAGASILVNYQEISQQMITKSHWKPTWFEQQILTITQEDKEEEHQPEKGRRQQHRKWRKRKNHRLNITRTRKTQRRSYQKQQQTMNRNLWTELNKR